MGTQNFEYEQVDELFERQKDHKDLIILDKWIEFEVKKNEHIAKYFSYLLKIREDNGPWETCVKVVKLCKVYNVPKELREVKALMVSQDELLSSIWHDNMSFITVYCNMPDGDKDDVKGFYYCYGTEVTFSVPEESREYGYAKDVPLRAKIQKVLAKTVEQAEAAMGGLLRLLRGNFRQAQFSPLTMKEAEAIRKTIEDAPNLQVIRGIPKTHISPASGVTTALTGVTSTPDGVEQNEEFIRALLHDKYANVIMASPIPQQQLLQWSDNIARELSKYKSQYSGMKSFNAGISIPMVFAGNLSASTGSTVGVTETTGETAGVTEGLSDSYSHSVGSSIGESHNLGYSMGNSHGFANSLSESTTESISIGQSDSTSVSDSVGQSHSVSNGLTEGITETDSVGRSHTVGSSESYSEGQSLTEGQSHSVGKSVTRGETVGTTDGVTKGISHTRSQNITDGISNGQSLTRGHTVGNTIGNSLSHSVGQTLGDTYGQTEGLTRGQTHGFTLGETNGITRGETSGITRGLTNGMTYGQTVGNTDGYTTGTTRGQTIGTTIGDTTGHSVSNSTSTGLTYGHSEGTSHTVSDGTSSTVSNGTSYSNSRSTSDGTSTNHSQGSSYNMGQSYGASNTVSRSHGTSSSDSSSWGHASSTGQATMDGTSSMDSWNNAAGVVNSRGGNISLFGIGGNSGNSDSMSFTNGGSDGSTHSTSSTSSESNTIGGGHSSGVSDGTSISEGRTSGQSFSQGTSISNGTGTSHTASSGVTNGTSTTNSNGVSHTVSNGTTSTDSISRSMTNSTGYTDSNSHSVSNSNSTSLSNSVSNSLSNSNSTSLSQSQSTNDSASLSESVSRSRSVSNSESLSDSLSHSLSNSHSRSLSNSVSDGQTLSQSNSLSDSLSRGESMSRTHSVGQGLSIGETMSQSHSVSRSNSLSIGNSESYGETISRGQTWSHGIGSTVSDGISESHSRGISHSNSHSISDGVSTSRSVGHSQGFTQGRSQGISHGVGTTQNVGTSQSITDGHGVSRGTTMGDSRGTGRSVGESHSTSNAIGSSTARSSAVGTGQALNFSFGPNIGVSRGWQTYNEEIGNLARLLENHNTRFALAARQGAFYVDAYIVTYTAAGMRGASLGAATSWGGDNEISMLQCVRPTSRFIEEHLLKHLSVFQPCTMKDYIPGIADNYLWSTIMLTSELAALTHLPRVETGGVSTVATNIPPFSVFANKRGQIYFGKQINHEDGETSYDYYFDKGEFMHTLIAGASGCGKTTSAVRIAREVIRNYPDFKMFVLDWKKSWRVLKNFAPNGVEDFTFYGLDYTSINPIHMNVYVPPKYMGISQWCALMHETLCIGYGFGSKMYSVLQKAAKILFLILGVLKLDESGIPRELPDGSSHDLIYQVTLAKVYLIVSALKAGAMPNTNKVDDPIWGWFAKGWKELGNGQDDAPEEADKNDRSNRRDNKSGRGRDDRRLTTSRLSPAQQMIQQEFMEAGRGMQDAFDSILAKLMPYYNGELKDLYCCEDAERCIRIEELIDGKRIVVLEGGNLDTNSKKFVCQMISTGMFNYCSAKKNIEQRVEKRLVILEEAHRIIENPENGEGSPLGVTEDIFNIIFNEGREFGLYATAIVQAPSELPANVVTNCSILIVHRLGSKDDIDMMTTDLCRNGRLDNRDIPIWIAKQPIGQAIVRINNTATHQESEPVLVQVARCANEPPDNEELVSEMGLDLPDFMRRQVQTDKYIDRDALDKEIEAELAKLGGGRVAAG